MSDPLDEKHVLSVRNALIAAIIIVLGYVAISILLKDNEVLRADVTNVHTVISDLFATLCLFYGAYNSRYYRKMYIAWTVLALSRLSYTIGDFSWLIIETVMHQSPFPSLADAGFLGFYPLFALGILILPKEPLTSREKLKVILDTGIVMIASAIIFWIQLIAPTISSNASENAITSTLTVYYPVADLVLLFGLIELLFRRVKSVSLSPIFLLVASMCFLIMTDFVFLDQSLKGTYVSGGLLDTGWIVAYALMGMAGVTQANSRKFDLSSVVIESKTVQFTWPLYIPSICIVIIYILLIWDYNHPLPINFYVLSWVLGGIIGLFVLRQAVALNENIMLYRDIVKENTQRKSAEEEIRILNEALEDRVADRTAQLESAINELIIEIQERKNAEEERLESQQLMSSIIDFLPDAIMALDFNRKVIIWNRAMEALTGVRSEDILGRGNYEHSLPFYGIRRPILIDMMIEPHEGYEAEYLGFQRDGNAVVGEAFIPTFGPNGSYLLGKATRLYDHAGKAIGVIESIRDMTDRRLIEQKLERTNAELHVAADIQKRFIPEHTPEIPGFDIAAVTEPAMEVGGDFYDFIQLSDGEYGIVIADVAGKSVPAAIFMALSRTIIRANISDKKNLSSVLSSSNKMIESDALAGMFVTLMYGAINRDKLAFRYSNAGHPPPLIFRSAMCRVEEEDVMGIALGVTRNADYREKTVLLCPGDIVVLYTDGVTEAMNYREEFYGKERLADVVGRSCHKKAKEIIDRILEDIKSFIGEKKHHDDLTLVILKAVEQVGTLQRSMVIAHKNEIPGIISRIGDAMSRSGFGDKENLNLQVAVEEACINIMNHGYRGAEGYISITLVTEPNCFSVIIERRSPSIRSNSIR